MFLWQFSLLCGKFMFKWIWRKSKTLLLPTILQTVWFLQRNVLILHLNCCQGTVFNKEGMHDPLCMYMYMLLLFSCACARFLVMIWIQYDASTSLVHYVYFCIVVFFPYYTHHVICIFQHYVHISCSIKNSRPGLLIILTVFQTVQ